MAEGDVDNRGLHVVRMGRMVGDGTYILVDWDARTITVLNGKVSTVRKWHDPSMPIEITIKGKASFVEWSPPRNWYDSLSDYQSVKGSSKQRTPGE